MNKIQHLVGTVCGRVNITKPIERTDRNFQTASWWEKSVSTTGVFDVYLRQDPYHSGRVFFCAEVPATIVEDYFGSSFCGNAIGKYDSKVNAGSPARRPIEVIREFLPAIEHSCASDGEDGVKVAIYPRVWPAFVEHCHERVQHFFDYSKLCHVEWLKGDDQYHSRIWQLGYAARNIAEFAKAAQEILLQIEYHDKSSTDYFVGNNPFV